MQIDMARAPHRGKGNKKNEKKNQDIALKNISIYHRIKHKDYVGFHLLSSLCVRVRAYFFSSTFELFVNTKDEMTFSSSAAWCRAST